ncbi:unnamed protein product [Anisakis simplex]|uniref:Uncharacterized protein n=1 Tax=Anisakis simplex TaxID=6269 RepID=A0A3P6T324_ANISI|nr:unnamed protein product [Anisakis simplex]
MQIVITESSADRYHRVICRSSSSADFFTHRNETTFFKASSRTTHYSFHSSVDDVHSELMERVNWIP